jgi:hypothetical protein
MNTAADSIVGQSIMAVTSEKNLERLSRARRREMTERAGKHNFAVLKYEIWNDNHNNKHIKEAQTHTHIT